MVAIIAVGLTPELIGDETPQLRAFRDGGQWATVTPTLPAVTSSVQATFMTGAYPSEHGSVGNGWMFRDELEVKFWRQSNRLVQRPKVWEIARQADPTFTSANYFWWYNMYSSIDYVVTPRPMYPADGRKIPDIYTLPRDLRTDLQRDLGPFPLFKFWGPNSSIESTRWIADAAMRVEERYGPTLTLLYLPHLDYGLQRHGPDKSKIAGDLRDLDAVCGDLIDFYQQRGTRVMILSEYGITAVSKPVHLNRLFRQHGMIAYREELGREMIDIGECMAFAVVDHQIAHVYLKNLSRLDEVRALLEETDGVAEVLDEEGKRAYHLDHPRAGDLVVLADRDAWFTYYWWLDDSRAPDYARTVDIHRKPGYDPVELFIDPNIKVPPAKVGTVLLKKQLGFRYLMDVVGFDASLIKGSHGLLPLSPEQAPMVMTQEKDLLASSSLYATDIADLMLRHLGAQATMHDTQLTGNAR